MERRDLGRSGLRIMPLVFGGNVFGWTIDEAQSFAVLDAFVDHGFDAIDTADCYSAWAPGNRGGESETIIGNWLKARPGMRDRVTIFTKVGSITGAPHEGGLTEAHILPACDASLQRLGIEAIDLYFAHWPDPLGTSYQETLGAFDKLRQAGKIRAIGVSNVDAAQLGESLRAARDAGLPGYQVLQPGYNLYDRDGFEGPLRDLCLAEGIGVVTYYSLAAGFLSGKYRSAADLGQSARGGGVGKYLTPRGMAILAALDEVAGAHGAKPAEVALAWLMAQPGATAPIASATTVAQVESFAKAAALTLGADEIEKLTRAGA
ncbi:aldo/keto reductase [Paracoccus versutus]|uniref:Aryl-alcohol dehydrogenase-like predicted oxidoreductase n=1 Tax=Paracoccus versutus TaxID=34007 RepID=A0AAQ0HHY3_PARVE|nr:aldo/keto reductase [Paracoccus versutus]KGJ10395.1 alcohol dehydrogenase [Paracoccus versutus]REG43921.1 aryl-alcohol dehydrogenase-like predicted oxidoreductase [Paracoccus versutus]WEJ79549.1 aldo/keto reductase [Paracoccus versutus]